MCAPSIGARRLCRPARGVGRCTAAVGLCAGARSGRGCRRCCVSALVGAASGAGAVPEARGAVKCGRRTWGCLALFGVALLYMAVLGLPIVVFDIGFSVACLCVGWFVLVCVLLA